MRKLIGLAILALPTYPMLQTWKLNSEKSSIEGAVPTFIYNGYLRLRPQTGPMPYTKTEI